MKDNIEGYITILILIFTIILYLIPKIPIFLTALMSITMLTCFGIIRVSDAASGFVSAPTLMVLGFMIIGKGISDAGLVLSVSKILYQFCHRSSKLFLMVLMLLSGALGVFLSPLLVVTVLMPIVDDICLQSKGSIERKYVYFPMGMAAVYGNITTLGASSTLVALGFLTAAGYDNPPIYSMIPIKLPPFIAAVLIYMLLGDKLAHRVFSFEETGMVPCTEEETAVQARARRKVFAGAILVGVVAAIVLGYDAGVVSVIGAVLMIVSGSVTYKRALQSVNWPIIVLVSSSAGISIAIQNSGAGVLIADTIFAASGSLVNTPFGICIILMIISAILSNFMSNSATAAVITPIAFSIALGMEADVVPFVFSVAVGAISAIGTPLATATIAILGRAGYRFSDYVKIGGLFNIIYIAVAGVMLKLIYYM